MDWDFLDFQLFSKAELLELSGLPRGVVEGYLDRGVLELQYSQPRGGSRARRTYTGRDIVKVKAISLLGRVGVPPRHVGWMVKKNGPIDLHLNSFQLHPEDAVADQRSPLTIESRGEKLVAGSFESEADLVPGMRAHETFAYTVFDTKGFFLDFVPKLERHLKNRDQES